MAYEYNVHKMNMIENVLIECVRKEHDKISSEQIIEKILEAEKFRLSKYLIECVGVASRKKYKNLVNKPMFEEISQETRLKISCKRWSDVDSVVDGTLNPVTGTFGGKYREPYYSQNLEKNLMQFMQNN